MQHLSACGAGLPSPAPDDRGSPADGVGRRGEQRRGARLHFWTTSAGEKAVAAASFGYTVDDGIGFFVSPTAGPCLTGVYRLQFAGNHVYTVSTAERDLLVAAGWADEGIRFYVGAR